MLNPIKTAINIITWPISAVKEAFFLGSVINEIYHEPQPTLDPDDLEEILVNRGINEENA
jgi:hypothetical protein